MRQSLGQSPIIRMEKLAVEIDALHSKVCQENETGLRAERQQTIKLLQAALKRFNDQDARLSKDERRSLVLRLARYCCRICGRKTGRDAILNVHHIVYNLPLHRNERVADLRCLCRGCHIEGRESQASVHGDPLRLVTSPDGNGWASPEDRVRARARIIIDSAGGLIEESELLDRLAAKAIPRRVFVCMRQRDVIALEDRYRTCLMGDAMGDAPTLFFMTSETWSHWTGDDETEAEARSRAKKLRTWSRNPVFSDRDQPDYADRLLAM